MFELLRTAFKLAVTNLTLNKLIFCGLIALFLMICWSVISLLFNNQVRMRKNCVEIIRFLRQNDISADNYPKFIAMWKNFPIAMKFEWKRYEIKKTGRPSDYLKREECIDFAMQGGLQKQNRSLMRTVIVLITVMVGLCSVAMIGSTSAVMKTNAPITTTLIADMLLVPFVVYIALMINYYVYTSIRHQQYRMAVEVFYDFVDILDEKVDLVDVFGGEGNTARLIASVYINETEQFLIDEARKKRSNEIQTEEIGASRTQLSPLKAGVLGVGDAEDNTDDNVIETTMLVSNKLSDENQKNEKMIMNESEFLSTVGEVETLLTELDEESNRTKRTEIEKKVNVKIKALTDYKQKAKIVKESSKKSNE